MTEQHPGLETREALALTPPMGWNSWNTFRCYDLNETVVRETAEAGRAIIRALAGLAEFRNDDSSVNPDRVRGFRRILSEGISDLLSLEPRPRPDELK